MAATFQMAVGLKVCWKKIFTAAQRLKVSAANIHLCCAVVHGASEQFHPREVSVTQSFKGFFFLQNSCKYRIPLRTKVSCVFLAVAEPFPSLF